MIHLPKYSARSGARHGAVVRTVVRLVSRELARAWNAHRTLITTNREYGTVLAGAAAEIIVLTNARDLLATLIVTALAVCAATIRRNRPRSHDKPSYDGYYDLG